MNWPDQFQEIKPDHASGKEASLNHVEIEIRSLRANNINLFHPCRQRARRHSDDQPGKQRLHIAIDLDRSPFPPEHQQEADRQEVAIRRRGERQSTSMSIDEFGQLLLKSIQARD